MRVKVSKMFVLLKFYLAYCIFTQSEIIFRNVEINRAVNVRIARPSVLSEFLQDKLVNYCLPIDSMFFSLRRKYLKRMAFQLAALKNNLKHPFSVTKQSAGKKSLRNFLKRHPELGFCKP